MRNHSRQKCGLLFLLAVASLLASSSGMAQTKRVSVDGTQIVYGGKPLYLFGQGDWLLVVKGLADHQAESDWYRPYGANLTRVKTINTIIPDEAGPLNPWLRLGDGRFDLRFFSVQYWARLRDFLAVNEANGRIVLLQMFDEVGLEPGSNRWANHPFHPSNNVNGVGLPSGSNAVPEFYDTGNPALIQFQQDYIDKLVSETEGFGNVIYEICNEYTGPTNWLQRWINRFQSAEAILGRNLLLTNMSCGSFLLDFERNAPGIDLLDVWHAPSSIRFFSLAQIRDRFLQYSGTKPILVGRIGPEPDLTDPTPSDRERARTIFWTILLSGGAGATTKEDGNFDRVVFGPPLYSDDTVWEEYLGAFHSILESSGDLSGFAPDPTLLTQVPATFSLAARSESGVVVAYLESEGGSAGGSLSFAGLENGDQEYVIYSPVTGHVLESKRRVVQNGTLTLSVPSFQRDLVVILQPSLFSLSVVLPGFNGTSPFPVEIRVRHRKGSTILQTDERILRSQLTLNGMPIDSRPLFKRTVTHPAGRRYEVFRHDAVSLPPGYHQLEAEIETSGPVRKSVVRLRIEG